jgi:hypothetical protein
MAVTAKKTIKKKANGIAQILSGDQPRVKLYEREFDALSSKLPIEEQKAIFREIEIACDILVESKRRRYEKEAETYSVQDAGFGLGLLGGGTPKRPDGTYILPPWENTPLKAFALNLDIAFGVAQRITHSVTDVLRIGAWNLSNVRDRLAWPHSGASDYLIRRGIHNLADSITHSSQTTMVLAESSAKKAAQRKQLKEAQKVGVDKRIEAAKYARELVTKTLFPDWRKANLDADKVEGYKHCEKVLTDRGYRNANGAPITWKTVKEYFRKPRMKK